uniref:Uncharacterized protein n=1 Tax=Arundo donax TaxID=35708 RepID=A0A0A9A1A6_ARUDO
MRATRAKTSS